MIYCWLEVECWLAGHHTWHASPHISQQQPYFEPVVNPAHEQAQVSRSERIIAAPHAGWGPCKDAHMQRAWLSGAGSTQLCCTFLMQPSCAWQCVLGCWHRALMCWCTASPDVGHAANFKGPNKPGLLPVAVLSQGSFVRHPDTPNFSCVCVCPHPSLSLSVCVCRSP